MVYLGRIVPVLDRHGHLDALDCQGIEGIRGEQAHQAVQIADRRLVDSEGIVKGVRALDMADLFDIDIQRHLCH